MTHLLILWHSRTGAAEAMAWAAFKGAQNEGDVRLLKAEIAGPADLLAAAGYLFAAPENLAALSGEMKAMFDRCYYPVLGQVEGRAYAQMIAAGSDGAGAARQLARIATGWRLKEVQPPLIAVTGAQTPEAILAPKTVPPKTLAKCRDLGAAMMAGLASGIW